MGWTRCATRWGWRPTPYRSRSYIRLRLAVHRQHTVAAPPAAPGSNPGVAQPIMITLTPKAIEVVKNAILASSTAFAGLRVGVQGGGCSGFTYKMALVTPEEIDSDWQSFEQDGLKVYVDNISAMYIEGVVVDFVEQLDGSGFKFKNPNVKHTCGCGQSFQA